MSKAVEPEQSRGSLIERGVKWDEHFNRRLGVLAVGVGGIAAVAGAPVVAGYAALFAGGGFVAAEAEQRIGRSFEKRRTGN